MRFQTLRAVGISESSSCEKVAPVSTFRVSIRGVAPETTTFSWTFEMRIFPIGAEADQQVQITYYQELDFDHDTATYVYPLASVTRRGVDSRTTGKFALAFDVKSGVPIVELSSPSHGTQFAISTNSPAYWQANLETSGGNLAQDVVVACRIERPLVPSSRLSL